MFNNLEQGLGERKFLQPEIRSQPEIKTVDAGEPIKVPDLPLPSIEAAANAAAITRGEIVEAKGKRAEQQLREAQARAEMQADELAYLEKGKPGLKERYENERTGAEHIQEQLRDLAGKVEIDL